MTSHYRLMTDKEILNEIKKGDTLYLDAEFNDNALHTCIAIENPYETLDPDSNELVTNVNGSDGKIHSTHDICKLKGDK